MQIRLNRWTATAAAIVLAVTALASQARPRPTVLDMTITAAPDVNPDNGGAPSPVMVRYFELRSPGPFMSADFFALFEGASTVLASVLMNSAEVQLQPGESRSVRLELNGETRYVAVMVAFQAIDQAQWRAGFDVVPNKINMKRILVSGTNVSVQPGCCPQGERRCEDRTLPRCPSR
ncbi:MAG: type VI secretion system lipoprotein TssJ [Gammaproteobacteria bacterium]